MNLTTTVEPLEDLRAEMLLVTLFQGEKELKGRLSWLDRILGGRIAKLLSTGEVRGQYKEFAMLHVSGIGAQRVLLIGLGKREELSLDRIRSVVAIAARNCRRIHAKSLAVDSFTTYGLSPRETARAIVEGVILGLYKFTKYMSPKTAEKYMDKVETLIIADGDEKNLPELKKGFSEGYILSENTNMVRDMVNEPASIMYPERFASLVESSVDKSRIKVKILDEKQIQEQGMKAFWEVARASEKPPRLVELSYEGNPGGKWVGLVGKGITFDSGGYDLKPPSSMDRMHCDMAGAAAVFGAIKSAAEFGLPINCVAVMPMAENMVSGDAYKPCDIIGSLAGKSIEVLNTDAEGRLLLADALTYTARKGVEYMIDIATLTGAIVIALGHHVSGVMGNNKELISSLFDAGERTGEKLWELPLYKEYGMQIRSDVADLENSGGRPAGSITAGIFLQEFVEDTKWAHIDIAGTATIESSIHLYVRSPFVPKEGATGVGVRLLYQFLSDLSVKGF